jgi:hypothetical protein
VGSQHCQANVAADRQGRHRKQMESEGKGPSKRDGAKTGAVDQWKGIKNIAET